MFEKWIVGGIDPANDLRREFYKLVEIKEAEKSL